MTHGLLAFAGLARPYRFERTFVVVTTVLLAVLAGAAVIHFHLPGKLPPDSPRY